METGELENLHLHANACFKTSHSSMQVHVYVITNDCVVLLYHKTNNTFILLYNSESADVPSLIRLHALIYLVKLQIN